MDRWFDEIVDSYENDEIDLIKELTLEFAKNITKAVLREKFEVIEELIYESCNVRDEIEFDCEMERNKEFYFGYMYAYENISRNIVKHNAINKNVEKALKSSEKLKKLVSFLGKNKISKQKDLAEYLGLKSNEFANFMNTKTVISADIILKTKMGRNTIYSLNAKGRRYYKDELSLGENLYLKSEIEEILKIMNNQEQRDISIFEKIIGALQENEKIKLLKIIIDKILLGDSYDKNKIYLEKRDGMELKKEYLDSQKGILIDMFEKERKLPLTA